MRALAYAEEFANPNHYPAGTSKGGEFAPDPSRPVFYHGTVQDVIGKIRKNGIAPNPKLGLKHVWITKDAEEARIYASTYLLSKKKRIGVVLAIQLPRGYADSNLRGEGIATGGSAFTYSGGVPAKYIKGFAVIKNPSVREHEMKWQNFAVEGATHYTVIFVDDDEQVEMIPLAYADEDGSVFLEDDEEYIFVWDEGKHPRFPKGHPQGGEWMSKGPVYNKKRDVWVDENDKEISKAVGKRMIEIGVMNRDLYNLRLNPDTTSGLVAIARDALRTEKYPMGRVIQIRTKQHITDSTDVIHSRGKDFNKIMPKIQSRFLSDMRNKGLDPASRDAAAALYFVSRTGMRIGSGIDRGAAVKGYGANTLELRHLTLKGESGLEMKFMGLKKGGMQKFTLNDMHLSSYINEKEAAGRYYTLKDKIFGAPYNKVNSYFKEVTGDPDFKIKDMRGWTANNEASKQVSKMPVPKTEAQFKKQRREVAKVVAARLGNTPAIALNFYISPAVFGKWEMK